MLLAAFCWRRLLFRTRFIAITGSVGKTTAKNLLAAMLRDMPALTLAGTRSSNSAKQIARDLLSVRPWHRFVVLEVGTDRPGWIRRSAWLIGPDIAIILSVARTHTNNFPTLDDTAAEKATLLGGLRRKGVAILNADDERVAAMAANCSVRIVRFSCSSDVEVCATNVSSKWPQRLSFAITARSDTELVRSQLVGKHWTPAVLGAIAAALECGMSPAQAAALVSRVPPTTGRMDTCILPCGATILRDDFNGSLDTFLAAFETLKSACAQRKFLVISTVGDSPESWNRRKIRIAAEASRVVNVLVLVGRGRDTKGAAKAALAGGLTPDGPLQFESLKSAAMFLNSTLRFGDFVLLRWMPAEHVARVYHAQLREVTCWIDDCRKRSLCDHCPELFADRKPAGSGLEENF
jgi:UDP-N-acetylmuramoyl-tripeptide--D-alanyl-D-alanine ligase